MLAECLLQLACLDVPTCTHALPSHVAAAALCVSLAAYNSTETIPRVLEACRWNDTDTLAHMSQVRNTNAHTHTHAHARALAHTARAHTHTACT